MSEKEWRQKIKDVFLKSQAKSVVDNIHRIVQNGTLGIDYTIAPREKNRKLRRDYNITDNKIKEILLDLNDENYVRQEQSDNMNHLEDVVHIFHKTYLLMPKWDEAADYKEVALYIKITWPVDNNKMFIISFHEKEFDK